MSPLTPETEWQLLSAISDSISIDNHVFFLCLSIVVGCADCCITHVMTGQGCRIDHDIKDLFVSLTICKHLIYWPVPGGKLLLHWPQANMSPVNENCQQRLTGFWFMWLSLPFVLACHWVVTIYKCSMLYIYQMLHIHLLSTDFVTHVDTSARKSIKSHAEKCCLLKPCHC